MRNPPPLWFAVKLERGILRESYYGRRFRLRIDNAAYVRRHQWMLRGEYELRRLR